jgi:apolipoprotein N-acyltransferase
MMLEHILAGWRGHFIALLAGMSLPLAFSPFHYYPVAVVSLMLLFLSWQAESLKYAPLRGFLFGLGMFGVGVSWVYVAIHDFGNASWLLAGGLTGLFVAFLASYLAIIAWFLRRFSSSVKPCLNFILLFPVTWLVFEWFKGWFLTGFPWLEVGVSQIDGPLAGFTPVIGTIGVSLLVAMLAGLLACAARSSKLSPVLLVALIGLGGATLSDHNWVKDNGKDITVTIIQGNIPQEIKWDREQLMKTLALYQQLTEQTWSSDLVVWPENAATVFYHQAKAFYLEPLAELARANNTDILLGLPYMDQSTKRYFNSMMSLGEHEAFYHKSHLVPFGDYVPMAWLRGLIDFFNLPMSSFEPGPAKQPLLNVAGHPVGLSICYEDVFSNEVRQTLPDAHFLVNATNNAWYGDSFAPHQHLQISQNRALEMGRPIIRATTNGISALIDQYGQLQAQTAQFEQAVLTGKIQPKQGETPYVRYGAWPVWISSLFMLLAWAYYRRTTSK